KNSFHRINSASVTCCEREVDEIKKKWKDARTSVKKKEAQRKRQTKKTGGGPAPEVCFKAWELDVLSMIPGELIEGIEGGTDTGRAPGTGLAFEVNEASLSTSEDSPSMGAQSSSFIGRTNKFLAEGNTCNSNMQVNVREDPNLGQEPTAPIKKRAGIGKKGKEDINASDATMVELVNIKRMRVSIEEKRLKIEERKAAALERVAVALEARIPPTCRSSKE
ncbi:uncharacterized protein LOC134256669, partial [Saccostrea cucullata]|uniref:uncharacterized protein LOC134256669 n=1 Tax=Saccostrea cuccullata TaxID=36930 RepID=UPI002ED2ABD4